MSLLLLFAGAGVNAPPVVCTPAFQKNAYQFNAFQTCSTTPPPPTGKVVGWPDTLGRRRPRRELERLLKLQKDATFGRKWFEEFEAAQEEFANAEANAAVSVAAEEAHSAAKLIHENVREDEFKDALRQVALTLEVTRHVHNLKDVLAAAHHAHAMAMALRAHFDDDEEAIALLLLH